MPNACLSTVWAGATGDVMHTHGKEIANSACIIVIGELHLTTISRVGLQSRYWKTTKTYNKLQLCIADIRSDTRSINSGHEDRWTRGMTRNTTE